MNDTEQEARFIPCPVCKKENGCKSLCGYGIAEFHVRNKFVSDGDVMMHSCREKYLTARMHE